MGASVSAATLSSLGVVVVAGIFVLVVVGIVIGFGLVALFIWFAENLGTLARAWSYPGQESVWKLVSPAKFGSWYLLMIISFVLVALVHGTREGRHAEEPLDSQSR